MISDIQQLIIITVLMRADNLNAGIQSLQGCKFVNVVRTCVNARFSSLMIVISPTD